VRARGLGLDRAGKCNQQCYYTPLPGAEIRTSWAPIFEILAVVGRSGGFAAPTSKPTRTRRDSDPTPCVETPRRWAEKAAVLRRHQTCVLRLCRRGDFLFDAQCVPVESGSWRTLREPSSSRCQVDPGAQLPEGCGQVTATHGPLFLNGRYGVFSPCNGSQKAEEARSFGAQMTYTSCC